MSGPGICKMKPKKRKAEKFRDLADAKRSKSSTRRGKGLLVPPNSFNVDSPESCEAGTEANVSIISQYGRRVSAPKRLSDDSNQPETTPPTPPAAPAPCSSKKPPERSIPTPGFRLVDDYENKSYAEDSELDETGSESDEEEEWRRAEAEKERSSSKRNTRSSGKAMYKGLLNRGSVCSCSVLVIEFDRGWRETGATVEMYSGHRGWYICVLQQEETLFIQEIRRKYFNYTTNKVTGAYIWRAEQDWMLEFETYSQLTIFKKLYEKCFLKNQGAAASIQAPAAKFRMVKDLDPRWRGPAFIRPAHEYMSLVEMDMDARVLYDMDSEDEKWLSDINGKAGTYRKISEHKFEKAIYCMEKYSHDRNELLSERMASVLCLHVASLKIIKLVHGYWIEKRRRKGISLVRHFQHHEVECEKTPEKSPPCSPTKEPSLGETVQNNSSEELLEPKETTQPTGSDSPSLPEVCNETPAAAAPEEAESPQQTQLVWKKFTGRASAEERKKLRVMNQLRQSGIKHFTRRKKDTKAPGKSNTEPTTPTISVEEAARELFALADAAMHKRPSVTEVGKCNPPAENSEAESDIETLELAREKAPPQASPANPPQQLTELQKEKLRLRQQMQKLKQQMRAVDDEMSRKKSGGKLGELAAWSAEVEHDFNEQQQARRNNSAVGFKRIRRTASRLVEV